MVPDIYTHEKLALEHRHTLLREAEHERMLLDLPEHSSHTLQRLAGRLGVYLIALGTRLQRLGQRGHAVEYHTESSS